MAKGIRTGRFRKELSRDALDFLAAEDLEYDKHLVQEDILGSKAHVVMLWRQGIIPKDEAAKLLKTLEAAGKLHSTGHFPLEKKLEDVHMNIEDFITRKVGAEVGGKIHTGRSRNDQVALDGRLYIRNAIITIIDHLKELVNIVLRMATEHVGSVMPGYTHLQHAQPITVGHWASAYGAMLLRDIDRLTATFEAVNICPLGAVASAGTSWPIDRTLTAQLLGFRGVQLNALDAVSSRGEDVAEYLSALSLLMMHLSRVAQDIVLWSSPEFGMVEVDEAFATGSSIMPQKKNPDVAELIRAKAASVHSEFLTTVSILRALPTGYFKDSQETKHSMIRATETAKAALKVTAGMLSTLKLNVQRMRQLASANYSTATDLADFIAQKADIPFRQAHRIVGLAVARCVKRKCDLRELDPAELSSLIKSVAGVSFTMSKSNLLEHTDPSKSVKAKRSLGGTSPSEVKRTVSALKDELKAKLEEFAAKKREVQVGLEKLDVAVAEAVS